MARRCQNVCQLLKRKSISNGAFTELMLLAQELGPLQAYLLNAKHAMVAVDRKIYAMVSQEEEQLLSTIGAAFKSVIDQLKLVTDPFVFDNTYYQKQMAVQSLSGMAIFYGLGYEQDKKHGIRLLEEAADQRNPYVCFLIAEYLLTQEDEDPELAVMWLRRSAEAGYAKAQSKLGELYSSNTVYLEFDKDLANEWYSKAAKQDEPQALYWRYLRNKNQNKKHMLLKRAAEAGSLEALFILGSLDIRKEKLKNGCCLLEAAANCGHKKAMVLLAYLAEGSYDSNAALHWCAYAAAAGEPEAQEMLGFAYEKGRWGLEKNFRLSDLWYERAISYTKDYNDRDRICCKLIENWLQRKEWNLHQAQIKKYLLTVDDFSLYPKLSLLLGDLHVAGSMADFPKKLK